MKVINECRINYKYRLSSQAPIISKTMFSNTVSTQIIKDTLEISKSVNKKQTYPFDVLIYTIIISNIGKVTTNNLFFQDNIPMGTDFIENSITVNEVKKRCLNPENGFRLGSLKSQEKIKITFKVLVLPIYFCKPIINYSTVGYDYIYNVEKPPYRDIKKSNYVKTICEDKLFKQVLLENTLEINIDEIINDRYKLQIIEIKLINSPHLNLFTLLIIGKIEYEICYRYKCNNRFIKGVFGFSTDMLVPIGITFTNKEDIKGTIEYASSNLINNNKIFMNISLLLYY
ncbi:DUF11 domain-containing protein [Romboutsia lituseburensis]|uniref:DUF11 domain-containing protein n=1 Tax=Romboutsia lituseburensis TaxID=1537 RepID=UPI00215ACA67|nr:DUF11 domain-containing protein [Romboutsia lituseburensis]MCR8746289.1 DUF11 domain-containing protein [Romboutsia lituseburensis]